MWAEPVGTGVVPGTVGWHVPVLTVVQLELHRQHAQATWCQYQEQEWPRTKLACTETDRYPVTRPLLDRYSTRYIHYTPRNMQALDILGVLGGY